MTTEAAGLGLTGVLAAHREAEVETVARGWVMACDCGWDSDDALDGDAAWAAHVAEEVRTWLRTALTGPEVVEAAERAIHSTAACEHMDDDLVPYCDRCDAAAVLAAAAETLGAK